MGRYWTADLWLSRWAVIRPRPSETTAAFLQSLVVVYMESTRTTPYLRPYVAESPSDNAAAALQAPLDPLNIGCFSQELSPNCQMQGFFPDVGESMAVSEDIIADITIVSTVAPNMLRIRAYVPESGRRRGIRVFFEGVCTGGFLPEDAVSQLA